MENNSKTTLQNVDKKDLKKALERHEQTIMALAEFIKGKMNVHGEIRKYVATLGSSFKRIVGDFDEQKPPSSTAGIQTSPSLLRTYSETTAKDTEIDEDNKTPNTSNRRIRKAKRKERTSPEKTNEETKKLRREEADPFSVDDHGMNSESEWTEVKKKTVKNKRVIKRERASVLIIRPKEKEQYADILKRVKQDPSADQFSQCVDKIRRTNAGDMLFILTKKDTDKAPELKKTISELLGNDAVVVNKLSEEDLEIKDLDETVTKQEILEAIQKVVGDTGQVSPDTIKATRKAYGGTITASVRLESKVAKKVLECGKIKIGWVNCRIRSVQKPTKCYRCWNYGHFAKNCNSTVDRTKSCIKCGETGHKIAECTKEAKCALCLTDVITESSAHIAGSGKCPVFRKALLGVRKLEPCLR